ncbi:DsbA family protein [Oceanithermus sp.]
MQRAIFFMILGLAVLLGGGVWYLSSARTPTTSGELDPAAGAHFVYGSPDAPVTVVEFSNYLCPHCKHHAEQNLLRIFSDYVETGKVRYVFRDFPFQGQENVILAGEAAACAADQGRYLDYHLLLFRASDQWGRVAAGALPPYFKDYARQLGLNAERFGACLDGGSKRAWVLEDQALATKLGLTGTPSFFVNGKLVEGFRPYEEWQTILDDAIAQAR